MGRQPDYPAELDIAGREAATYTFLVNEIALRPPEGWRISAIVPVPAQ